MPPNRGVSWPSSDMNCGAKVPIGVLLRVEFDRNRVVPLRPGSGLLSCVSDWFRRCAAILGSVSASGDETRPDFGRVAGVGPGDGDAVFLAKGLCREVLIVDSDAAGRCVCVTNASCKNVGP
jgi:hypothetical protein